MVEFPLVCEGHLFVTHLLWGSGLFQLNWWEQQLPPLFFTIPPETFCIWAPAKDAHLVKKHKFQTEGPFILSRVFKDLYFPDSSSKQVYLGPVGGWHRTVNFPRLLFSKSLFQRQTSSLNAIECVWQKDFYKNKSNPSPFLQLTNPVIWNYSLRSYN